MKFNSFDIVTTYYTNTSKRNFLRRTFTRLYNPFLNFIFGLKLPYYNGLGIYKRSIINNINISTNSFTWQIEVIVRLFKAEKINYVIIPTKLDNRIKGESKAFSFKNSIYVIFSITRLFIIKFFLKKRN